MPYWVCYYHVTWATKYRQPLITTQIEPIIFRAIEGKSAELRCPVLGINGVSDHVHVAVCIPPSLSVAQWVGNVKGSVSHAVNVAFAEVQFKWQESYGVLTFGTHKLPFVQDYIARQKEHHAAGSVIAPLERTEE